MSNKDLIYIRETLLKSYANSSLITEEFISNLLDNLKEEGNLKDVSQTIFTCKKIINDYLVEQARKNENILLELVFDMFSVKERICLKLKLDLKNPIYDDYLMEGILNYDGSKSLDLYLSSFLMQKIKTKYVPEKSSKKLEYKSDEIRTLKEKKSIKEEELLKIEPIVEEVIEENLLQKETLKKDIASLNQPALESKNLKLTKKQLRNQRRREAKKDQVQTKNEDVNSFEVPIEDLENLITLDRDESKVIEDVTKDVCEPLDEKISEEELANRISEVINTIFPTEEENIVTKLYKLLDANKKINIEDNIFYYYYTCLRFGTKEKTYSLEIIATTLGLSIEEVISFEEYTVNQLKELLNTSLEKNNSLTFK